MNYLLEQRENNVFLQIENSDFCYFSSCVKLKNDQIKIGSCNIDFSVANEELILNFFTDDFEVISIFFDSIHKINSSLYYVKHNSENYLITANNSTIIANRNLIIGVSGSQKVSFKIDHSDVEFNNPEPLNVFRTQMYVPNTSSNFIFRNPPSFSITLYTDNTFSVPLSSFKDRQIISGISTVYVKVVSDQNKINSNYVLNTINDFNFSKSYDLTYNSLGFSSTSIKFTNSDFKNYLDGKLKFFVSVDDFTFTNTIRTQSVILSDLSTYNPITIMSGSFSSSHYNSGNFRIGVNTFSWNSIGFSTISPTPNYIINSGLSSYASFPTLNTSAYTPISYSTTYNGFIGANLIYNFGTSGISFSTSYDWAGVTFIAEDNLSSSVNISDYDIKFFFNYAESTEPTVISPVSENIQQNSISVSQIPYTYNFISAQIPFNQSIDTSKTLTSFETRISKVPSYVPQNFRAYEFKIFNYTSVTISQFNAFNIMSEPPIQPFQALTYFESPKVKNTSILGINKGDIILGFDLEPVETEIVEIYEGIVENIYKIETEIGDIEIPESYQVVKDNNYVNLWNLKKYDDLKTIDGFTKIINIQINNYKPHYVIQTKIGNYFANEILVRPQITLYHKKTKPV